MEIIIRKEANGQSYLTGGGYAVCTLEVSIDKTLPEEVQREIVIHEILENWCPFLDHSKIVELTDLLTDGLDKLKE